MKLRLLPVLAAFAISAACAHEGDVARVGQAAPGFSAASTEGAAVSLASLKGKVVLLDFFAMWCGPCMAEMPFVERDIWRAHQAEGLVVLAIGREHQSQELAEFKAAKGFTFGIVADPHREIYRQYATEYIPRCYVVGRDGLIKFASVGFGETDFARLKSVIAAELKR